MKKLMLTALLLIVPFLAYGHNSVVIDVRTTEEFNDGHVEGANNIPFEMIGEKIDSITTDKSQEIVLYCRSGRRAGIAQESLEAMGYQNVKNLETLQQAKEYLKDQTK